MSRDLKKKKKSTSKYREFKISPLIPIIAIVEVLVLIGASTYAWFIFAGNKQARTGVITVDADSGLDIDFKYANTTDTINIWNYIDDDFTFEPATSIDGRNIFFPTSGSFPSKDVSDQDQMLTKDITFREGTINDVNSKYLSIDFDLTNTSDDIMDVYLKNSSKFTVKNGNVDEDSKALRLAFYPNDGSQGDVRSNMFGSSGSSSSSGVDKDLITVYYDNSGRTGAPYIYVWNSSSENSSDATGNTFTEIASYPGSQMTYVGDSIYSFTFNKNYDMCIFNDGSTDSAHYDSHKLTGNLYTVNDQIYYGGSYNVPPLHYDNASQKFGCTRSVTDGVVSYDPSRSVFEAKFSANKYKYSKQCKTVYFSKPASNVWSDAYAYIWENSSQTAYRSWPGAQMSYVGGDVYSYTYYAPSERVTGSIRNYDKIVFNNGFQLSEQDQTKKKQSNDTSLATANNRLYYFNSGDSGAMSYKAYQRETNTIYFYNTHGWAKPYIKAKFNSSYQDIAMTTLTSSESVTGAVYYATVPGVYDKLYFYDKTTNSRTVEIPYDNTIMIRDGYIYRPTNSTVNGGQYKLDSFSYDNYTANGNYAVISPGVSAGFQRAYNPVVSIDNATGAATQFVPAFSDSIDNYIYGSDNVLFTIEPNHMISLSMVVWLEGTDEHCTNLYAGNNIDLYLEFTTLNRRTQKAFNNADTPNYKYRFVDATREKWTSDRLSTESGVTVSPVMQLYDRSNKRGYLMKAAASEDYQGKSKVSVWECNAPASIAGNDLEFRRVNPYNESEVWNYWYCGPLKDGDTILYPNAVTLGTDETDEDHQKAYVNICTFTAFADGAPATDAPATDCGTSYNWQMSSVGNSGAPAKSCGGLWGRFSTTTLTMIDGTGGQSIKNATSNYSSALTINYGYRVKGSDNEWRTVNIEYKGSGPEKNTGYFFVVPTDILRSGTHISGSITFKKYDKFNPGFAMNIPYRNADIKYVESYPFTDVTYGLRGQFGYIGYTNATYNYWGSDVIYLQAQRHISDKFAESCSVYVRFFSSAGNKDVQVFNNYQYNVTAGSDNSDTSTGYCCVIPCDKEYTGYQLRRTQSNTPGTVYNNTENITIDSHSRKSTGCYENTVSKNICSMDYYTIRIYFNNGGWGANYDAVDVHYWGDDVDNVNDLYHMYSTGTTDSGSGHTIYQAVIPSYASIQFKSKDTTKPWSVTLTSPGDGYMYWPNGETTDNGTKKFTVGNSYRGDSYKQRNVNNSDIHANMYNSPDWM